MSQRILKCIICGANNFIFQCPNRCASCHGDHRQCGCLAKQPAKKMKKQPEQTSSQKSDSGPSYSELKKLYKNLQKEHERVGLVFQNQQDQVEELAEELEQRKKMLRRPTTTCKSLRTWSEPRMRRLRSCETVSRMQRGPYRR